MFAHWNALVTRGWFHPRMLTTLTGIRCGSARPQRALLGQEHAAVERAAYDVAGRRIVRRVHGGALAAGALASRARESAIAEIWRSVERDPEPGLGVLRRVELGERDVTLVYDAFDGSLSQLLDDTLAPGGVMLPLSTIVSLRAVLVAGACTVTSHDLHGLRLRSGRLSASDVVVLGDAPYVQLSAFEDRDEADLDDVDTSSFGEVLATCVTGVSRGSSPGGRVPVEMLRPGLPDAVSMAARLLSDAPAGMDALADRSARVRNALRSVLGRVASPRAYANELPGDLVSWQLSLLAALDRLGADDAVDRYLEMRATCWHAHTPEYRMARSAWTSCRSLPVPFAAERPLPRAPTADHDAATAFLARARRAFRQADVPTAWVAWQQAVTAAPADVDVWIEFAKLWGAADCEEAEAFGLAEALCCAKGDAAAVRTLVALVGAGSASGLGRYFEATGHGPVAAWLAAMYG